MDRFCVLIGNLARVLWARHAGGVMAYAMMMAIYSRVARAGQVIRMLAAALEAGTLRVRRSPAPGGTRRAPAVAPKMPEVRLPRGFGWLLPLVPCDAACFGNHLRLLLEEPEMQALLAASPRAVRTLKPLCRMLGVEMPKTPVAVAPVLSDVPEVGAEAGVVSEGRSAGMPPRAVPAGDVRSAEVDRLKICT